MNVILLRGLIREKRHWGSFTQELQIALPAASILTPEIPGVGQYHQMISPDTIEEIIHFVRKKHEDQISGKKNIIVAMSLGGMIAKRWGELYPDDFQKMILVNTSFKGINSIHQRMRPLSMLNLLRIFFMPDIAAREGAIVRMTANNESAYEAAIQSWIEIQKTAPVSRKSAINQIRAALALKVSTEKPKQELTIIAAPKDRLCNYESSLKLHELWGGTLRLHPTAGHDFSIDDPKWLIEEIKKVAGV